MAQFSDVIRFLSLLAFLHIIASSYKHTFRAVVVVECSLGSSEIRRLALSSAVLYVAVHGFTQESFAGRYKENHMDTRSSSCCCCLSDK